MEHGKSLWKISFSPFVLQLKKSAKIWKRNREKAVKGKSWRGRRGMDGNLLNVCRECANQHNLTKSTCNLCPCAIKTHFSACENPTLFTLFPPSRVRRATHTVRCAAQQSVCAWFLVRFLFRVFIWRRCVSILEHNVLSFSVVIGFRLSAAALPLSTKANSFAAVLYIFLHKIIGFQLNNNRNTQNMGLNFFLFFMVWHYISAFVIEYIRINRNLNSLRRTFLSCDGGLTE